MPVSAKQLNFCDVSNDLLSLLDKFISISDFIPLFFLPKILF